MTIGLCCLTQVGAKALFGIKLPEQDQLAAIRQLAGWNWDFVKAIGIVLIAAPVIEELVFRLVLFRLPDWAIGRFVRSAIPTVILAVLSSAVFSAVHYLDSVTMKATGRLAWLPLSNAFLALAFFGGAQCWLYRKTKRIWCPMLNHALFNLANLVLMFVVSATAS